MARNFDADMDPFGGYEAPARSSSSSSKSSAAVSSPASQAPSKYSYSMDISALLDVSNDSSESITPVMSVRGSSTKGSSSGFGGGSSSGDGVSGFFSRPTNQTSKEEEKQDSEYDPLGFLGNMAGYAQATYDKAVEAFKGQPEDRSAAISSVTDSYASALEKAAYESAMLVKEQRKAGFSTVPEEFRLNAVPEVSTTELPPALSNVSVLPNMPAFDMRDPMSRLREDDMDMNSAMERFGAGGVKMVGEEELPTVDTSVPAPAPVASGAGLMSRPKARQGLLSPNTTEQIKAAQSYLGVTADGIIGKNTRGAIKDFQRKAGVSVSGKLDDATKQAMQNPDALDSRIIAEPSSDTETSSIPDIRFLGNKSTPQGDIERSVYEYAYKQGLRDTELKAFMAQVAHESTRFSRKEELKYTKSNVNNLSKARYSVGSIYKRKKLKAGDPMVGQFKNTNRRRMVRDGVTDAQGNLQNYSTANVFNSWYANRNGNGNFASGDGNRYRGRGYIQLTGRRNYRAVGKAIGVDLEGNPDLVLDPDIAKKASVAWWQLNVQPENPDYTNVKRVTRIVNGGTNGLADRLKKYNHYSR